MRTSEISTHPPFLANNADENRVKGLAFETGLVDCLSVLIWEPYNSTVDDSTLLAIFMTSDAAYTLPFANSVVIFAISAAAVWGSKRRK